MNQRDLRNSSDRAVLTPDTVIEAALSLTDMEGLGAVTIRRLARDLGVTPMALYWHFRSKNELLDGIVERLYAEIDSDVDENATWQEQFRGFCASILGVLRSHPSTAVLLATRNVAAEDSLRTTETALDILGRGGFSPSEATQIVRHTLSTVTNLVSGFPGAASEEASGELMDAQRRTRVFLESLPPERYPRLVEAAVPLSECEDTDAYYAFGLDLLLVGIETLAEQKRRG